MTDHATFFEHRGETFTLAARDRTTAATLTACDLTDAATGSFTLDFHAPASTDGPVVLDQDTYLLRGHGIDTPVFLVPSGQDSAGITLHAVFNNAAPTPVLEDRTSHE